MNEKDGISNDEKQKEKDSYLFTTPLWYYRLQAKRQTYIDRKFGIFTISAIIAGFGGSILLFIFARNPYYLEITIISFFILLTISLYIFWRLFAKESRLDLFEKFAYFCEGISLDFNRISIDSELPVAPLYSINSVEIYLNKMDKLNKKSNKKLKIELKDFSKKLDNILVLFENPIEKKLILADLSKKFNELAEYAYYHREITSDALEPVYNAIKDVVKPDSIDKFINYISSILDFWKKSKYIKKMILIGFDVVIFFGTFQGFILFLGVTNNYALGASMALFIALLLFILAKK